jgi:peptide/nickel transport system ATP-binding protein/oligopeptide transport system ATP-binding protein
MTEVCAALLEVRGLKKHYPIRKGAFGGASGQVRALDGIDLDLHSAETVGVVGESGCGKSTAGKAILRLIEPTAGSIRLNGVELTELGESGMRPLRRQMQVIFQDPYASLNPRMTAERAVGEPLINFGVSAQDARARVAQLFARVGLRKDQLAKYPHEFSGGQRQRLGIARALALNPSLIVCDEPVSALDVSVQAQVINLLKGLQEESGISFLFISHDLAVVRHVSHRVAVMYLGEIVELADKVDLFASPLHPYTLALLASIPDAGRKSTHAKRSVISGDVPSPANPPPGCRFHTRCPLAVARCRDEAPKLRQMAPGHSVACHLV